MINTATGTRLDWIAYKNGHNQFTIALVNNGSAYDISAITLTLTIYSKHSRISKLILSEGDGITNGGADGTIAIALTQDQAIALANAEYFYEITYLLNGLRYRMFFGSLTLTNEEPGGDPTTVTVTIGEALVSANVTLTGDVLSIKTVTVTSAQILDLHNTSIEILPAPGAGKFYRPTSVDFIYLFGTVAYTASQPFNPSIHLQFDGGDVSVTSPSTSLLPSSESRANFYQFSPTFQVLSGLLNKSIKLVDDNAGNGSSYSDGDGTLTINIIYRTITV